MRKLKFKSGREWKAYCKSGKKPVDIPNAPRAAYDEFVSMPDWLGAGRQIGGWRPFEKAREFAHKLKLSTWREWKAYCESGKKPADIPSCPDEVYDKWISRSDWFGRGKNRRGGWRPFPEARKFIRRLKLKSQREWNAYAKSGEKPTDIPTNPQRTYAKDGWKGWADFLGFPERHSSNCRRSFKEARAFVHRLSLNSRAEWEAYCKSGEKPADIPAAPRVYHDYAGFRDWLGSGRWRVAA